MSRLNADASIIEFESPAARVIEQFSGKDEEQFRIPVDLPDISFLRALSVQGRLRYFSGTHLVPISIVPPTGETLFIGGGFYNLGGSVIKTITVGTTPMGVAVNSYNNRIYVANKDSNTVSVIDGSTDAVITTIAVGTNPSLLDIMP